MSSAVRTIDPDCARLRSGERVRMRSNLVWMVTGNVWSGFCQWALLVVLAKLGTVEMVGAFTLGVAINFPILMFSCLNLRALYVTDCSDTYRFREYFALRLVMVALSVAFTLLFALTGHYGVELVLAIALIGLAKAFDYIGDMLYALLQKRECMTAMSISMMLRGTLSVGILGIGIYTGHSLLWGAGGLVLASSLTLVAFDLPISLRLSGTRVQSALREWAGYVETFLSRGAKSDTAFRRLRSLAFSGVPLGLVLMLVSLNVNIPRYFLEHSLGTREQGIFSSLANLMAAGSVVVNASGQCASGRLAKYFAAGEMRAFRGLLWALMVASIGLGVAGLAVAVMFGRQALGMIYRPEYGNEQGVFIWLMAASGALYLGSTLGVAMTAVRCLTPQLPLFAVAAGSTAVSCFFLIPRMGLRGAAAAIFISAMIQCAGGAWLLWNACNKPRNFVSAMAARF